MKTITQDGVLVYKKDFTTSVRREREIESGRESSLTTFMSFICISVYTAIQIKPVRDFPLGR